MGRAGRAVDSAFGILLSGREDDEIQEYFINSAFPPGEVLSGVLDVLGKAFESLGELDKAIQYYRLLVRETDLHIQTVTRLASLARELVLTQRGYLEAYIRQHPLFLKSLAPWRLDSPACAIVRDMAAAGERCGVGPMAAVAGWSSVSSTTNAPMTRPRRKTASRSSAARRPGIRLTGRRSRSSARSSAASRRAAGAGRAVRPQDRDEHDEADAGPRPHRGRDEPEGRPAAPRPKGRPSARLQQMACRMPRHEGVPGGVLVGAGRSE